MKVNAICVFQYTVRQQIVPIDAKMNNSQFMGGLEGLVASMYTDLRVGLS